MVGIGKTTLPIELLVLKSPREKVVSEAFNPTHALLAAKEPWWDCAG